ncbi:MAG: glycosyltransferase [Actinomycetota bacterium]|nr:glycosyltransferase [Actinomycetota bacterium]
MTDLPLVTIVIPVRNEEDAVEGCIRAIASQTYPREEIELIMSDGLSDDHTVALAEATANAVGLRFRLVTNANCGISSGLNAALATARGEVVVRVDARARIQPTHVSDCVETLIARPEVGVVGGRQIALPRSDRTIDVGIARALRNRYATGLARYRSSTRSGATDTVWMGTFRRDDLRRLGGWDEKLELNEDYDLNRRYRLAGWLVWFDSRLSSGYLPRRDLASLALQHYRFGRAKGRLWARGDGGIVPRHVFLVAAPPLALVAVVVGSRRFGAVRAMAATAAIPFLVDAVGEQGPRANLQCRAVSSVAMSIVGSSWWAGVVAGVVGAVRRGEHEAP